MDAMKRFWSVAVLAATLFSSTGAWAQGDGDPLDESETAYEQPLAEPEMAPVKPPRPPSPFDKGRIRLGLSLGWIGLQASNGLRTESEDWMILGISGGYYVMDGLELGAGTNLWLIGSPFIATITPGVRYVFHMVPKVKPYVGTFYRHYFVSNSDDAIITGGKDTDSVGARMGAYIMAGPMSYFGGGAVYEHFLDEDLFTDRNQWYPEIVFALAF